MLFIISATAGAFFFALTWHSRAKSLDKPTVAKPVPVPGKPQPASKVA